MIRQQQSQIQALQTQGQPTSSSQAVDDSTPTSERSMSLTQPGPASQPTHGHPPQTMNLPPRSRQSLSRQSSWRSRPTSQTSSPALRPISSAQSESNDWSLGPSASRDESAFYQAETQMLTRENQMLKMRIRELERQLGELGPDAAHRSSSLSRPPITGPEDAGKDD